MHHCVVQIRIEFLSNGLDHGYTEFIECCGKLFVYFIHAVCERIFLRVFHRCKSALEAVNNRKNLLDDVFCSNGIHICFFFFGAFAEVIELCHLTGQAVSQLFDFLIFFIFFLFEELSFFAILSSFFCSFRFFCLCCFLCFFLLRSRFGFRQIGLCSGFFFHLACRFFHGFLFLSIFFAH